ncbi:hypothetical protein ACH4GZ_38520 [Streptomyces hygroscopicus]|uniref:hypothetical protein n=1 Tax=Streptomyces hygroscopicus TaxID=1912 RepID=UPI0037919A08
MTTRIYSFPAEQDEFLRRARTADARKAQRVHARVLATAIEQFLIATLPHTPTALTEPMVEMQVHTPGPAGALVAAFQLPEPIINELAFAIRRATAKAEALTAEHSRTADIAPTAPVRALRSIPGGGGR